MDEVAGNETDQHVCDCPHAPRAHDDPIALRFIHFGSNCVCCGADATPNCASNTGVVQSLPRWTDDVRGLYWEKTNQFIKGTKGQPGT